MSKQTAVDLYHRHIRHLVAMGLKLSEPDKTFLNSAYRDSKAMEREQIVDAFVECWKENMPDGYECKQSAEQYYQETYKGGEQ